MARAEFALYFNALARMGFAYLRTVKICLFFNDLAVLPVAGGASHYIVDFGCARAQRSPKGD